MGDKPQLYPCIRCGRMPDENDKYCIDCGVPVHNRCSDEPGILKKGCSFVNPPTAAYCAKCGEPTVYQLHGLIQPLYPGGNRPAFLNFK
ncbi:zinc ribbon domain-containing protein [Cohnella lubricantis]|uniref:Zinc ribbon domain-containing protein n=1 Tax=Cohnella lubricantis TaxID=2163172 RepID=A0A841TBJ6_9BACL|nr:zinc ribbon domain-containing protein [Cohnella lubricantis]MBB6678382.1 zinc ribbon domain-containing protein [Cohnella lubricantis]MBP2116762.1 ribosomal protein L37E [Cohnella lubricantis]